MSPAIIAEFAPFPGDGGAVITAGLVSAGRFSIRASPAGSDRITVHQFPLVTSVGEQAAAPEADLGEPVMVDDFYAFDDSEGSVSLATGWVAADQGGVVVGQGTGDGSVRVFAWASRLNSQSAVYVEDFHDQHHAEFGSTLTVTPLGAPVTVAPTSTTSGADILVAGRDGDRFVANVSTVARSGEDPTQLKALLRASIDDSSDPITVAGG